MPVGPTKPGEFNEILDGVFVEDPKRPGQIVLVDAAQVNIESLNATVESPAHRVELSSPLVAGGTALAKITEKRDGEWRTTSVEIAVEDALGMITGAIGDFCFVRFDRQANAFLIWQKSC